MARPSKYQAAFADKLVEHMGQGHSFESFGAVIKVARSTLYEWEDAFEGFSDAKKRGLDANLLFWETIARQGATGQLRRVTSEEPVLDADGDPAVDAKGRPVMKRRFAPAVFNATVWVFTMKNMHKWRDRVDFRAYDGREDDLEYMSLGELEAEGRKLLGEIAKAKAEEPRRKK